MREFYKQKLIETAKFNRALWEDYAQEIEVDESLDKFPKMTEIDHNNKRKVTAKDGPTITTPISALRKRKEPKRNEMNNKQPTASQAHEQREATPPKQGQYHGAH